jgi:hypothetical protein
MPVKPGRWEQKAYEELQYYVKQMTGKPLLLITANSSVKPRKGCIYLGKAACSAGLVTDAMLQKLKFDGYALVVKDGNIGITSRKDDAGVIFGVYALLDSAGVKIYGHECEVVPNAFEIATAEKAVVVNPAFESRIMHPGFFHWNKLYTGKVKARLGFSAEFDKEKLNVRPNPGWQDPKTGIVQPEHSAKFLIPKYLYLKTRPEYFAKDRQGKMIKIRKHIHSCYSNPDVKRISKERVLKWMADYPEGTFYTVTQDDLGGWCECDNCRKLDPKPGARIKDRYIHLADRLLHYVNYIAKAAKKKFPDKLINTLVYRETGLPPIREKVESNVRLEVCPSFQYYRDQGKSLNHPANAPFKKLLEDWLEKAPGQIYCWSYCMNYTIRYSPYFSLDAMNDNLKLYNQKGVTGVYYCGIPMLFSELFCYVQGKLLWNPKQDPVKLEDEFLKAYYGAAAPMMKELLQYIRKRYSTVRQSEYSRISVIADSDYINTVDDIFKRAEEAAANDPASLKRLKFDKLSASLWPDLHQNISTDDKTRYLKMRELVMTARDFKLHKMLSSVKKEWIETRFPFNMDIPKREKWYNAPVLKELTSYDTKNINTFIAKVSKDAESLKVYRKRKGNTITFSMKDLKIFGVASAPFKYSYMCQPRLAAIIYGLEKMEAYFILEKGQLSNARLEISGLDDDKPGETIIRILINGHEIFSGANPCRSDGWTDFTCDIPQNFLKEGKNYITIVDSDRPADSANWFAISKMKLVFTK